MSAIDGLSLNSSYFSSVADTAKASAAENAANKDYSEATDAELLDACKEFESYFVEQLFKSMRATVPEDEESGSSYMKMFEDSLYQEYASNATDSGQLGIAQSLYEQMKRTYEL